MGAKRTLGVIVAAIFLLLVIPPAHAFELTNPLFSHGVTERGSTGLLKTRGGTSIEAGRFILGLTPEYFSRDLPAGQSEDKITVPVTVTYGFPFNLEGAVNLNYVTRDAGVSTSGIGDIKGSLKWSFLQQEGKSYPSIAGGAVFKYAVADANDGLTEEDSYGYEIFISSTALIDLGPYRDYGFAVMGDVSLVYNEKQGDSLGEYGIGVVLPIPNHTELGVLLELNGTINRGQNRDKDMISLTPSVRYQYGNANFTFGVSYTSLEASGEDSYFTYTLQGSVAF